MGINENEEERQIGKIIVLMKKKAVISEHIVVAIKRLDNISCRMI